MGASTTVAAPPASVHTTISSQGHVAGSANHTDDPKLGKRLDRIYSKLQRFLDSYDDSGPSDRE